MLLIVFKNVILSQSPIIDKLRILILEDEEKLAIYEIYAQNLREFKKQLIDISTSTHYNKHFRRLIPCEEELVAKRTYN